MKVINKPDESGRLVYSSEIIRDIVNCALGEVDGIVKFADNSKHARDCIKVDLVEDSVHIDAYVKIRSTSEIVEVACGLQNIIKNTVESMTEFKVKDVNVHVIDVEFEEN